MRHTILERICLELKSLGFESTSRTYNELIDSIRKYKLQEPIPKMKYIECRTKGIHSDVLTDTLQYSNISEAISGNFGTLYTIFRTKKEDTHISFLKVPKHKETSSLHIEAVLQAISNITLSWYGFPWAVPRVLDIVRHPHFGISFSMEKCTDATLFKNYLEEHLDWGIQTETNDYLILGVISQLATYLAILEEELILNHRDLTGSNVLMIVPTEPTQKVVVVGTNIWTLYITHKTILVDFGFACLGSVPSKKITVSAGDYFADTDFCPKEGRDLFLFIASLWQNPLLRKSMTQKTQQLIHKWLSTSGKNNWAQWIEAATTMDMRSMYLLTMSSPFSNANTKPIHVLKDISSVFPFLVYFHEKKRSSTPIPRALYE